MKKNRQQIIQEFVNSNANKTRQQVIDEITEALPQLTDGQLQYVLMVVVEDQQLNKELQEV